MLTVTTMSGAWTVDPAFAIGGGNFGLVASNWTWIVALPSSGTQDTTTFRGSITDSGLNGFGDRDCVHYDLDGTLILYGDKFTRKIINPVGSGYVGPPIRLEEFYFPCGKYNSFTAAGILTLGLTPWTKTFPNHQYPDNSYQNCWMRGEVDGNFARVVYHSEKLGSSGTWIVSESATEWKEFNPATCKWRWKNTTTWKSLRTLTNVGLVSGFHRSRLTSSEWGRIITRLSRIHPVYNSGLVLGDLCRRCANDAQLLDLNGIEYLSDVRSIVTDLKGILSLLKGKATLKSAAKLFLNYKYGVRLTIQDTISIFQAIPRHLAVSSRHYRWVRAAESTTSMTVSDIAFSRSDLYHYKIYYEPYDTGLMKIIDESWSVGLFPSLQNSWDLIPLSFVVDWFTQLSDRLSAYDAATFWSCNKVLGSLQSIKTVFDGVGGDVIFPSLPNSAGVVTVTKYSRFGADTVVTPTFFSDTPLSFKNYAEASALLIARSRRLKR